MATKSDGYEAYRKAQLEDGLLYQDFIVSVAWQAGIAIVQYASKTYQLKVGESRGGFEIKHDKKMATSGNLYIETAEKARPRPGDYAPSGIMREGHWMYVIGDYDVVFFLPNNLLRGLFKQKLASGKPLYSRTQTETSQGFLLPKRNAEKYAALTLRPAERWRRSLSTSKRSPSKSARRWTPFPTSCDSSTAKRSPTHEHAHRDSPRDDRPRG